MLIGNNGGMMSNYYPCDECTACCDGKLIGNSYGNMFGNNVPCKFMVDKKCQIYKNRPSCCVKYQCAWTQKLFPIDMRPDKCGLMVSVETDTDGKKMLKVMELIPIVEYRYYKEINKFCENNDTYFVKVPYEI